MDLARDPDPLLLAQVLEIGGEGVQLLVALPQLLRHRVGRAGEFRPGAGFLDRAIESAQAEDALHRFAVKRVVLLDQDMKRFLQSGPAPALPVWTRFFGRMFPVPELNRRAG